MTTYYCYVDPRNEKGDIAQHVIMTEEDIIKEQHEIAYKLGREYESDEDALQDFIVVHWAWKLTPETFFSKNDILESAAQIIERQPFEKTIPVSDYLKAAAEEPLV